MITQHVVNGYFVVNGLTINFVSAMQHYVRVSSRQEGHAVAAREQPRDAGHLYRKLAPNPRATQ